MSSGFITGGTTEDASGSGRDWEWQSAHKELEAERKRKAEAGKQEDGKSLYEVLQANKAAKQEAFEESIRLKNQFRSLDEDEVEFLDSLLESTRAKEAALKKETAEQLELFHRQREEAEKAVINEEDTNEASRAGAGSPTDEEQWLIPSRKRRRAKEKESFPGVKLRKASSIDAKAQTLAEESSKSKCPLADVSNQSVEPKASASSSNGKDKSKEQKPVSSISAPPRQASTAPPTASSGLGLVDYDSDDD